MMVKNRFNLEYKNKIIQYEIIRSSRKTVSIVVYSSNRVVVKAPDKMSNAKIKEVVEQKADWIISKTLDMQLREVKVHNKTYQNGEKFLFIGTEYELDLCNVNKKADEYIRVSDNKLNAGLINIDTEMIKYRVIKWYKAKALEVFTYRIEYFGKLTGLRPYAVKIKEQKKQWGSLSSKGNMNLNWRLIMAPIKVIDYVIVHELCHLRQMNHSKDFWHLVEGIIPDYKSSKKWLNEYGYKLFEVDGS